MNPLVRHSLRVAKLVKRFAYFFLPPALYSPHKGLLPRIVQKKTRKQLARAFERRYGASAGLDPQSSTLYAKAGPVAEYCAETFWLHEDNARHIKIKAGRYRELLNQRIDRVRLYREIARLERSINNQMISAVYAIRAMRLLGEDRYGDLNWSSAVLEKNGYTHEVAAADAMFGPHTDRRSRCRRLLDAAYDRCRVLPPPCEFAIHEDRRGTSQPRVTVIVSLYNAAAKMPLFIDLLRRQTILRSGQLEVIFVDSASPMDEHTALRSSNGADELPYLFVRTPERESIQTAWNRGITLARAPYLAFLGVDETVLPTAYEELAAELDAHSDIDWVMADSLVTEVDTRGNPVRDVMPYDRAGYTQDHVHLETCYLSWVGGLYRRSIHERFGYYDGTYRAAGDTEFKNRVMPFIRSKHVPRTLGLFLNYPEERTTASPRAELEDLRAWYLHRTPAGIDYAFGKRNPTDLETMILRSLGYRKSYCRHWSSDVEYAHGALEVLRGMAPMSQLLVLDEPIRRLVDAYRSLDCLPSTTGGANEAAIVAVHQATVELKACVDKFPEPPPSKQSIFDDNRFEQHTQQW